jgi:hypothetical protein
MGRLALALVLVAQAASAQVRPPPEPYSCQMYREKEKQCSYVTQGKCYVQHEVDRLRQQCLRDGGRV